MRNLPRRHSDEAGLRALCNSMMAEAQAITAALGLTIPEQMMERRLNAAGSVVGHKISMLQDLERGRSLEIDALVTAVQEVGRLVQVETPTIDTVLAWYRNVADRLDSTAMGTVCNLLNNNEVPIIARMAYCPALMTLV
jgi:ketopantoate reductase